MVPEYTDPTTDGIDHINIYSKGYTKLGRLLSNFAKSEFTHPIYGHFMSVEGFWYYIKLEKIDDIRKEALRSLYGFSAKQLGRQLEKDHNPVHRDDFIQLITDCITIKIMQSNEIKQLLIDSTLPFAHYYVTPNKFCITPKNLKWLLDHIESVRYTLKEMEKDKCLPDNKT